MFTIFLEKSAQSVSWNTVHLFRRYGSIAKISIRCSYTCCEDSLCHNAHCRQPKSILSDNYSLHKWICEHSFNFQNLQDIQLHCQARKEVLLLGGCLAYQNSSCFFSFLLIICSLAWNGSARLRTWVLGRNQCISATWGRPRCRCQQAFSRPRRPGSRESSRKYYIESATFSRGDNKEAHLRSATDNQVVQCSKEKVDLRRISCL